MNLRVYACCYLLAVFFASPAGAADSVKMATETCTLPKSTSAVNEYERATADIRAGKFDRAVKELTDVLMLSPRSTCVLFARAMAYRDMGSISQATQDFGEIIQLSPTSPISFNNRGFFYEEIGEFEKAIADFDLAIRLDPEYADAFGNRGTAYAKQLEFSKAIADFDREIRLDPNNPRAYFNRGTVYSNTRLHNSAIEDFDTALRLSPNFAAALANRCWDRAVSGTELNSAFEDCNAALRADRDNVHTIDSRALVELRLGMFAAAIVDYSACLKSNGEDAAALFGRGIAELYLNRQKIGDRDIQKAGSIDHTIERTFATYGIELKK